MYNNNLSEIEKRNVVANTDTPEIRNFELNLKLLHTRLTQFGNDSKQGNLTDVT